MLKENMIKVICGKHHGRLVPNEGEVINLPIRVNVPNPYMSVEEKYQNAIAGFEDLTLSEIRYSQCYILRTFYFTYKNKSDQGKKFKFYVSDEITEHKDLQRLAVEMFKCMSWIYGYNEVIV